MPVKFNRNFTSSALLQFIAFLQPQDKEFKWFIGDRKQGAGNSKARGEEGSQKTSLAINDVF
jgi:hypothetical protein